MIINLIRVILFVAAGICLAAIGLRRKIPLIGGILSPKIYDNIDRTDKHLILCVILFLFCFIVLSVITGAI
jgi:hypothetical protein